MQEEPEKLDIQVKASQELSAKEYSEVLELPKTPPFDLYAPLSIEWREIEPW